jgi:hypothetical protein
MKQVKGQTPTVKTGQASLPSREGPSPIGPGPVVPKGAPPPSSKGSICMPKQVGSGSSKSKY